MPDDNCIRIRIRIRIHIHSAHTHSSQTVRSAYHLCVSLGPYNNNDNNTTCEWETMWRCDDVTMVNYLLSTNIRLYCVLYCWCWCSVVVVIFVLIFFGACTYVRRTNLWLFANKNKDWNASYSSKWDIILTMDLIFARSKFICVSLHNIPPHMCGAAAYSEAFKHRLARKNTEFTNAEWICKALVVSNSNLTDESRLITMKKQRINTFGRVIIHVSMNTV